MISINMMIGAIFYETSRKGETMFAFITLAIFGSLFMAWIGSEIIELKGLTFNDVASPRSQHYNPLLYAKYKLSFVTLFFSGVMLTTISRAVFKAPYYFVK